MDTFLPPVIEKYWRKERWYARLEDPVNGSTTMPYANYIWLQGNPAFNSIPKGYVVHHLDHDQTNDDVSNLVIMQKHHHMAHHHKQKIITPKISVKYDTDFLGIPKRRPTVRFDNRLRVFYLDYYYNSDDTTCRKRVGTYKGKSFQTKEQAEKAIASLWPYARWHDK